MDNVINGGIRPQFVQGLPQGFGGSVAPQPIQKKVMIDDKKNDGLPKKGIHFIADHGGCGWWRMNMPELAYNYHRKASVMSAYKIIPNIDFYRGIDFVKFQRQADPNMVNYFKFLLENRKKHNLSFKIIYEIDDVIFKDDIPDFNVAKEHYTDPRVLEATISMMKMSDMIVTSTEYLSNYYKERLDYENINTIPNMSLKFWFDRYYSIQEIGKKFDKNKKRPRILYSGSGNHFDIKNAGHDDDFAHVIDHIIKTKKEFKWVFLGSVPPKLRGYVESGVMEHHPWDHIVNYPSTIWNLDIGAVIAPLLDCRFNRAKSDIKYLEASYLGIPGVFQDITPYTHTPLRFTDGADLINKLRKLFDNRQQYVKLSKQCRRYAETMWLDDNLDRHKFILG